MRIDYTNGYYEGEYKDNKWYGNGKIIDNEFIEEI